MKVTADRRVKLFAWDDTVAAQTPKRKSFDPIALLGTMSLAAFLVVSSHDDTGHLFAMSYVCFRLS